MGFSIQGKSTTVLQITHEEEQQKMLLQSLPSKVQRKQAESSKSVIRTKDKLSPMEASLLANFEGSLMAVDSLEELAEVFTRFKKSSEYKALTSGRTLVQRLFDTQSPALQELRALIKAAEHRITQAVDKNAFNSISISS